MTALRRAPSPDMGALTVAQRAAARGAYLELLEMGAEVVPGSAEVHWQPGAWSVVRPFGPEPFTWGRVVRVHAIGPDRVVEHVRIRDGVEERAFSAFPGGGEAAHSWGTLDEAVVFCIAYRRDLEARGVNYAANESARATRYFMRMVG